MESLGHNQPVRATRVSLSHLTLGLQPDDAVTFKYDKPQRAPAKFNGAPDRKYKDPPSPNTTSTLPILDGLDHLRRFMTYYYSNHVSPSHIQLCPKRQMLLPGAAQMVLFDDNSYLVTRLTPAPAPLRTTTTRGWGCRSPPPASA